MTAKIISLNENSARPKRVYGLCVRTNTVAEAQQLAVFVLKRIEDDQPVDRRYEASASRTEVTIWGETPAAVARLLDEVDIPIDYRHAGHHVRYLTEPELMEPVMWVDFDTSNTDCLSIIELVADIRGEVIQQRGINNGRRHTRVQAPLSELFDLQSRVRSLCDAEVTFKMGFSHYARV